MSLDRETVCLQTAEKLRAAAARVPSLRVLVGLDGFVDAIVAVVDKRQDFEHFEPIRTIDHFGRKISHAAGQSSNYELVVKQTKLGGNGPIMANALAALGIRTTYIGCLGHPTVHPVFAELADKADVISIAEPGHTDALEFDDGKLMLGKHSTLGDVNWENLIGRVGRERLIKMVDAASLVCLVNWTMLPHMSDIWSHLIDEVLPATRPGRKRIFIDLADPEKRTAADVGEALALLGKFQRLADVTLGLNLKEALAIASVLGLPQPDRPEQEIEPMAREIRARLGLACVVIHPRAEAAAATAEASATFAGPLVQHPLISTGAGDHFNAGFALAHLLGFSLDQSLCLGVATSGHYVRTAESPDARELADFVAHLPPSQAAGE